MNQEKHSRRYIRYHSEPHQFAQIDVHLERASFQCDYVALIVDEAAMSGCGLVCNRDIALKAGDLCRIKLGDIAPYKAEIVWVKVIDDQVVRMGCRFIE